MEIFTLRKTQNGGTRGAKYRYSVIDATGKEYASYNDNRDYVAAIVRRHGYNEGVGYTVSTFTAKPSTLSDRKAIRDDATVFGIALIETVADEDGPRALTRVPTGRDRAGEKVYWDELPAFWSAFLPAAGFTTIVDDIFFEPDRAAGTGTPKPALQTPGDGQPVTAIVYYPGDGIAPTCPECGHYNAMLAVFGVNDLVQCRDCGFMAHGREKVQVDGDPSHDLPVDEPASRFPSMPVDMTAAIFGNQCLGFGLKGEKCQLAAGHPDECKDADGDYFRNQAPGSFDEIPDDVAYFFRTTAYDVAFACPHCVHVSTNDQHFLYDGKCARCGKEMDPKPYHRPASVTPEKASPAVELIRRLEAGKDPAGPSAADDPAIVAGLDDILNPMFAELHISKAFEFYLSKECGDQDVTRVAIERARRVMVMQLDEMVRAAIEAGGIV